MYRFSCRTCDILEDHIIIGDKQQCHHMKDVLRIKPGERVIVFDESGNEYNCVISQVKNKISLDIKSRLSPQSKVGKVRLTIACAIPKKAKIDDIIDKLVQLGAHRIIPLKTERVVVKLNKHKEALRLERWKRIALSAAKQCQRNDSAIIDSVKSLKEVIAASAEFDLKLIPNLLGERKSLKDIFVKTRARNILVIIGPEGDFSPQEVSLAQAAGFIPVTLGNLVLRVDTAAIAVSSFINFYACD